MTSHMHRDLADLKKAILAMGSRVEDSLRASTKALVQRRTDLAREVIAGDTEIDRLELELDDECLKILALHQPVAGDLRFVTASMKIINDLERIGDLTTNIAQRVLDLEGYPPLSEPLRFEEMTSATRGMLRDSLNALIRADALLARDVLVRDDVVDDLHREHFEVLEARMKEDPMAVESAMLMISSSRHLERVADLATNIAEDVVFMVEAVVLRHRKIQGEWRVVDPGS